MSTSQAVVQHVVQHLPFLRRYARALSGNQESGDAYVAATLESLISSPKILDSQLESAGCALSAVHQDLELGAAERQGRCRRADFGAGTASDADHAAAAPGVPAGGLEGFSEEDAAQILECDLATLRGLVEESGRELAAEIATDVLIIEDETFIAMDIEALVESLGHKVIGVARTHSEAVALAHKKRPGLILADIQLADGSSGLDAVNELLGSFEVPVIFITAYPERFLTGQRPEPAFLIAKPFQLAVVSAVASQALFFGRKARLRDRHVA